MRPLLVTRWVRPVAAVLARNLGVAEGDVVAREIEEEGGACTGRVVAAPWTADVGAMADRVAAVAGAAPAALVGSSDCPGLVAAAERTGPQIVRAPWSSLGFACPFGLRSGAPGGERVTSTGLRR